MSEYSSEELSILSSIQLFMANPKHLKPEVFGSGCIINYKNSQYLLSVFHNIKYEEMQLLIETNWPPDGKTTPVIPLGNFVHFDLLQFAGDADAKELLELIEKGGEKLDITFAKIQSLQAPGPLQEKLVIDEFSFERSPKLALNFENISEPKHDELYSFFGNIKHEYQDIYLSKTPTLKRKLTYRSSSKGFHKFQAPKKISSADEYEGCSGAPILDSEGRLVALACKVAVGTNLIYGFPISECKKLLDMAIDANQI